MPSKTPDWIDPDNLDVDPMSGAAEGKYANWSGDAEPGQGGGGGPDALVSRLTAERDEAIASRQRALADFANFQRRANENEQRAVSVGAARVVRALLGPIDHLELALGGDAAKADPKQVLAGVRMVRDELARALESQGVTTIVAARGDEFDPNRHEAMLRQPASDLEPNSVVQTLQSGYAMGDVVLRPAKVVLAG